MALTPLPDRIYLPQEQVVVKFPGHAGKIQVIPRGLPEMKDLPETRGVFKPVRLVINLKLEHADQPRAKILKFDPPIEVRVRYTADDYADKEKKILRMAYWDEENKKWIPFTKAGHKFSPEWDASMGSGWAVVFLKEWGDPPIAVGT